MPQFVTRPRTLFMVSPRMRRYRWAAASGATLLQTPSPGPSTTHWPQPCYRAAPTSRRQATAWSPTPRTPTWTLGPCCVGEPTWWATRRPISPVSSTSFLQVHSLSLIWVQLIFVPIFWRSKLTDYPRAYNSVGNILKIKCKTSCTLRCFENTYNQSIKWVN